MTIPMVRSAALVALGADYARQDVRYPALLRPSLPGGLVSTTGRAQLNCVSFAWATLLRLAVASALSDAVARLQRDYAAFMLADGSRWGNVEAAQGLLGGGSGWLYVQLWRASGTGHALLVRPRESGTVLVLECTDASRAWCRVVPGTVAELVASLGATEHRTAAL